MKKRLSIFLTLVLCLSLALGVMNFSYAANVGDATIGSRSVSRTYEGTIELPITLSDLPVDNGESYGAVDIEVTFDPEMLTYVADGTNDPANTGNIDVISSFQTDTAENINAAGRVKLAWYDMKAGTDNTSITAETLPTDGDIVLATLNFVKNESFTSGSTNVELVNCVLTGNELEDEETGEMVKTENAEYTLNDGRVSISVSGSTGGGSYRTPTPSPSATPTASESPSPTPTPTGIVDGKDHFNDLDDYSWAEDAIDNMAKSGIMVGISDTEFGPGLGIRRGDITLMTVRMFNITDEPGEQFSDVPESSYYADAIARARTAGVAQGYGDNIYLPEQIVTRQEMVAFCYRALEVQGLLPENVDVDAQLASFVDADEVSEYARESMATFISMGIIIGREGNTIAPNSDITRAEAAVIFDRLSTYIAEN